MSEFEKIIFLDIDGVLYDDKPGKVTRRISERRQEGLSSETGPFTFSETTKAKIDLFDKKAVNLLNRLIEQTGAQIVLISEWRHLGSIDHLRELFSQYEFSYSMIDKLHGNHIYKYEITNQEGTYLEEIYEKYKHKKLDKGQLIELYLMEHKIDKFVIIDDYDSGISELYKKYYVKPEMFQEKDAEKALRILS